MATNAEYAADDVESKAVIPVLDDLPALFDQMRAEAARAAFATAVDFLKARSLDTEDLAEACGSAYCGTLDEGISAALLCVAGQLKHHGNRTVEELLRRAESRRRERT